MTSRLAHRDEAIGCIAVTDISGGRSISASLTVSGATLAGPLRGGSVLNSMNALHTMMSALDQETVMAMLTIRNLDPAIKERLRVRAAQHGRSMEAEVRGILQTVLMAPEHSPERNLYERIRARFAPIGGIDLEVPPREPTRDPPRFD
jgi:plasmid stability protein